MFRSKFLLFVAFALVVVLFASAAIANAADPVSVTLNAQNDSGQTGTATLTDLGNGKIKVEVNVSNAPAGVPQPLHIHKGTCANLDPRPAFPLTNAVDGVSVTEIDATLAELQNGDYAINGHKSAAEASVYVFCGDIPALATSTLPATGADFTTPLLLLAVLALGVIGAGVLFFRAAPRAR